MKRRSILTASVVAAALAAVSASSLAAGPGKGGGGPGGGMSPGMGAGSPAVSAEETGAQPQFQHRHRVGEKDTGRKVRAEGEKAEVGTTSVAPMEVAPAE